MSGQLALRVGAEASVAPVVVWETLPIELSGAGDAAARAAARCVGGGES